VNLYQPVLEKLTLEQLQEALNCLYNELPPQDEKLQNLELQEWGLLAVLLGSERWLPWPDASSSKPSGCSIAVTGSAPALSWNA